MKLFIGTDIGGTFTDIWVSASEGPTQVFKTPTTADVLGGVIRGLEIAADAYGMTFDEFCSQISRFGHGTTVSLNALLTGNTGKTAVLTTQGFSDTLEIGRVRRQSLGLNEIERLDYYLRNQYPPMIPRHLVMEIEERIDVDGKIITPLNESQAIKILEELKKENIEAIAICTLWSIKNPVHEQRLRKLVKEIIPDVFVSVSHEVSPAMGEFARMSTTAANASLGPVAGQYLTRLETTLQQAGMQVPLLMMTCGGGVLPADVLNEQPVFALYSGPAGGVKGSQVIGETIGMKNVLVTDIGGTSFDVGVVADGRPLMRSDIVIAGADIRVHSIDVDSIGAGGGSIASVEFGELRVGPNSAGANPGPACYGNGGIEATATDADLVLGVLDPDNFIGGSMKLDIGAARRAIKEKVAEPLNLTVEEAAWGIREILDSRMADLLRRVTIERGYNPQDFVLFANGGAGPSHAWVFAEELGLGRFVVPAVATAVSAFGTANSEIRFTQEKPAYLRVPPTVQPTEAQMSDVSSALQDVTAEMKQNLESAGVTENMRIEWLAALRFIGQTHHLEVRLESNVINLETFHQLKERFLKEYETLFGRGAAYSQAGYELLSVRAVGYGMLPPSDFETKGDSPKLIGTRKVIFRDPQKSVDTDIYTTTLPKKDVILKGPCIIEFPGQSVVVPPDAQAKADEYGNLHVRKSA